MDSSLTLEEQQKAVSHESLHNCKRRTRWAIRGLIIFGAAVICFYQIYLVCVLYFTYPTNVDIRLDSSPFVHLPSVTVCSEIASSVLIEDLSRRSPQLNSIFYGKTRTEINTLLGRTQIRKLVLSVLQSLPIDQQHRYTVPASRFFQECHLPSTLNSNTIKSNQFQPQVINCSQFGPIVETISYKHKCFSLFLNRTGLANPNYDLPKDVVTNFKYLLWIQLNRDYIFNGFIFIHPPSVSHQYSNVKAVQHLDPNRHQSLTVAFEREIIRLLAPPYETDCHDYIRDGYQCRDQCMAYCKVQRYLQLDGWPGDVYAERNVTKHFSKKWINARSTSGHLEEGVTAQSLETCNVDCGKKDDCERIQYDVRTVRIEDRDQDNPETAHAFTIGILPPKDVQMVIRHVPKYATIEFLIYIGSLANLYLGFSAISVEITLLTYFSFSSKLQTKHVCIPIKKKSRKIKSKSNGLAKIDEQEENSILMNANTKF